MINYTSSKLKGLIFSSLVSKMAAMIALTNKEQISMLFCSPDLKKQPASASVSYNAHPEGSPLPPGKSSSWEKTAL